MKNLINFKSILLHSMSGLLFLGLSCSEKRAMDSKNIAEQQNISKLTTEDKAIVVIENDNDTEFLMEVAEMQLEEINLGKLAQQNGSTSHVKELGKMMEDYYTKSHTELTALAKSKSVSIPMSNTEDSKDVYKKLQNKTGNDFGKAYSELMVEHHEDAIDLFEKASTDSDDPAIRAWATQSLPALRAHLKHAETCKKECDKLKS